jgi:hypothetical protein
VDEVCSGPSTIDYFQLAKVDEVAAQTSIYVESEGTKSSQASRSLDVVLNTGIKINCDSVAIEHHEAIQNLHTEPRGIHLVVIDPETLKPIFRWSFDTHLSSTSFEDQLYKFLDGYIVAAAVHHEATSKLS